MLWILHWLISSNYRFRRHHDFWLRAIRVPERKLLHAIFPEEDLYIHCHCGEYGDKTGLCEKHKVVLSLGAVA